jgi:hypothetical protein
VDPAREAGPRRRRQRRAQSPGRTRPEVRDYVRVPHVSLSGCRQAELGRKRSWVAAGLGWKARCWAAEQGWKGLARERFALSFFLILIPSFKTSKQISIQTKI